MAGRPGPRLDYRHVVKTWMLMTRGNMTGAVERRLDPGPAAPSGICCRNISHVMRGLDLRIDVPAAIDGPTNACRAARHHGLPGRSGNTAEGARLALTLILAIIFQWCSVRQRAPHEASWWIEAAPAQGPRDAQGPPLGRRDPGETSGANRGKAASPGRRCKEGARVLEGERGTKRIMVAPPGAISSPLREQMMTAYPAPKNTGDDAWP
jgi:hypothetical protein